MKRPMFVFLLFYISGILLVSLADKFLPLGIICSGFLLVRGTFDKKKRVKIYIWALALTAIGSIGGYLQALPKSPEVDTYADTNVPITASGVVTDISYTYNGRQKIALKTNKIITGNGEFPLSLKIQVTLNPYVEVAIGSRVVVEGPLSLPEPARNPGGYNEKQYLGARKYDYKMYGNLSSEEPSINIHTAMAAVKNRLLMVYDAVLPEREAGILKSMVIGDRSGLDEYIVSLYKDAGIYHMLVISGLHISITAMFSQWVFARFLSLRKAAVLSIFCIWFYCAFTGASVSAVRASIMASVLIGGMLLYKEPDLISSASFSAILLLLYEPLFLFDIGFQYSFSAVLGIGFLADPISRILLNLPVGNLSKNTWVKSGLLFPASTSLAVFLATVPVQVYHFNYIVPWSIIVNLILIPLLPALVVLGFLVGLAGSLWIYAAHILSGSVYFLLKFYEIASQIFAEMPFAVTTAASPHYWLCIAFLSGLVALSILSECRKRQRFKLLWGTAITVIYLSLYSAYALYPTLPTVTMLDVGQGDCVVVENGSETFIIDGGGWHGRDLGNNTGANILIPYLDHRGIKNITGVFISHLDFDHAFGIIELLYEKTVEKVYLPLTADKDSTLYGLLEDICRQKQVDMVFLGRGEIIESAGGIRFMALHPGQNNIFTNENNKSMVLFMDMGAGYLFTGDVGFDAEDEILGAFKNLKCHVLKVAHHGSKNSTGDAFLNEIQPQIAIAGVGKYNSFGHPSLETRQRLLERGIPFYTTDIYGAIIIKNINGQIIVETMMER